MSGDGPKLEWEYFDGYYRRAKIFAGWLVIYETGVMHQTEFYDMQGGWDWRPAMTFVPDMNHQWILEDDSLAARDVGGKV